MPDVILKLSFVGYLLYGFILEAIELEFFYTSTAKNLSTFCANVVGV